jgi:hypothetical protein
MCDKCVEFDALIERYRRINRTIADQVVVDQTKKMIAELEAKKTELHPQ